MISRKLLVNERKNALLNTQRAAEVAEEKLINTLIFISEDETHKRFKTSITGAMLCNAIVTHSSIVVSIGV